MEEKSRCRSVEIAKVKEGTKFGRANFRCLLKGDAITADYVREQEKAGRMSQQMIAIIAEGKNGRIYLPPNGHHIAAALAPTVSTEAQNFRNENFRRVAKNKSRSASRAFASSSSSSFTGLLIGSF
ncbi:hypothetical protein GZH79_14155 [Loktanella sp. SALINAS62]|nr:hypothetical protein [Loktanella sp. SALINAS62]